MAKKEVKWNVVKTVEGAELWADEHGKYFMWRKETPEGKAKITRYYYSEESAMRALNAPHTYWRKPFDK